MIESEFSSIYEQDRGIKIQPVRSGKKSTKFLGLGAKELTLAVGLSTLLPAFESACHDKTEPVKERERHEWSEDSLVLKEGIKVGDWELFIFDQSEVSLAESGEKNFYSFLNNLLQDESWFKKLPEQDRLAYVNGLIEATRKLNSGLNLDNFATVKKNGTFKIPTRFLADPNPAKIYSRDEGGYGRLQELALADGYDVRAGKQQEIFQRSFSLSQEIPSSVHFYLDREGSEDSPARLAPDVIRRLDLLGTAFSQLEFAGKTGWQFTVTDVMRDPEAQAKRGSIGDSTHVTPRTVDISDGRFLSPEKLVVTYSAFDADGKPTGKPTQYAPMIDQEMRPILEGLAEEYGVFMYKEGEKGHYHSYIPEARAVDLHAPLARYLADGSGEQVGKPVVEEPVIKEGDDEVEKPEEEKPGFLKRLWGKWFGKKEVAIAEPPPIGEPLGFSELEQRFNSVFEDDYQKSVAERLTSAEVDIKLAELRPVINLVFAEAFPKKGGAAEQPYLSILSFPNFSDENRKKFGNLTFAELQEKAKAWRLSDKESEKKKWRAVSQAWLKDKTIELVKVMPPGDVERVGILAGSTVHGKNRPPFSKLPDTWDWKSQNKTSKEARNYVDAVLRLDLKSLDGSVDAANWRQKEQSAIDLLRRHGDRFGFRAEVLKYLTPEVMLAVMNAEFFSELDGRTFVETSSAVFDYNIVFGPSANDRLCSTGPVQLIESTFVGFLDEYSDKFRTIQVAEGTRANFVVPARTGSKKEGKRTVGVYDPDSFAQAMVGNPDSVIFYATFSVLDHTKSTFDVLFKNKNFRKIWDAASEDDRLLFVGSLAPLAINGGPGTAKKAAESMLVDKHLTTLSLMAKDMPTHTRRDLASRGAERGYDAMTYMIQRAKGE